VDALLASPPFQELLEAYPPKRVTEAVRQLLAQIREAVGKGNNETVPADDTAYADRTREILSAWDQPSLRSVINATGVVLHTNLGRAPLSDATREAMARAGEGFTNLEFDLEAGERGSRYVHCVELLRELTGAEDALVVNNNAAAVVLALNTWAAGREVLVSRGELVEIGGGFRIPDMLSRSGAILREVGTTNRTRAADYRNVVIQGNVAAILKVHRSNFRISGFTEEASLDELADIAGEGGIFLFHDLGSGLLADPEALGLPAEPRAPDSLRAGAQAVAISGDKLLGGPQAGILLGAEDVIGAMRENPLCRAFRVDKVTLAGLQATLHHYLDPVEAIREIPILRMLATPLPALEERAASLAEALLETGLAARVAEGKGMVGGGTYPGVELPTWTVRVKTPGRGPQAVSRGLREASPPVISRVESEEVILDLRTVAPEEDELVIRVFRDLMDSLVEPPG